MFCVRSVPFSRGPFPEREYCLAWLTSKLTSNAEIAIFQDFLNLTRDAFVTCERVGLEQDLENIFSNATISWYFSLKWIKIVSYSLEMIMKQPGHCNTNLEAAIKPPLYFWEKRLLQVQFATFYNGLPMFVTLRKESSCLRAERRGKSPYTYHIIGLWGSGHFSNRPRFENALSPGNSYQIPPRQEPSPNKARENYPGSKPSCLSIWTVFARNWLKKLISQTEQKRVFPDKTRKNQDKLTNRKWLTAIESDLSFSVCASTTEISHGYTMRSSEESGKFSTKKPDYLAYLAHFSNRKAVKTLQDR